MRLVGVAAYASSHGYLTSKYGRKFQFLSKTKSFVLHEEWTDQALRVAKTDNQRHEQPPGQKRLSVRDQEKVIRGLPGPDEQGLTNPRTSLSYGSGSDRLSGASPRDSVVSIIALTPLQAVALAVPTETRTGPLSKMPGQRADYG
ncbi:hypothetical protein PG985_015145 [Apiospora marii]|uniref:uncharacterized protein n=1 Tax=Apiospora marii TaxID=335849 RepID=UPI00312FFB7A